MPTKEQIEAAEQRRREIVKIVEDSDFLSIPKQADLARHFNVSQPTIAQDMKAIKDKLPKADPILAGAQIDKFVSMAIKRLEELRKGAESPRSEREMMLAEMSMLRQRTELSIRLGLIEHAAEKIDTTLHVKWGNE